MAAARAIALALAVVLGACAPRIHPPGDAVRAPMLEADAFVAADGARLPVRRWMPEQGRPRAIIVALHGFNDYSNFFEDPGGYLAQRGIGSYAYDQRGFGEAPNRGLWPGVEAYASDLKAFTAAVRDRHPDLPVYLLGESMGGAVVMIAMTGANRPSVDGIILAAPAVWGRSTMPWYQRWALWVGAHTLPWLTVTGRGLGIKPSDNIEMLIELGRDPLVIKHTRVGTIYGLANLMDAALASAGKLQAPALILYGQRDEIIPKKPTALMLGKLPAAARARQRVALYPLGYHMLLRDLGASLPWKDIAAWIADRNRPLPSGADENARTVLAAKLGED